MAGLVGWRRIRACAAGFGRIALAGALVSFPGTAQGQKTDTVKLAARTSCASCTVRLSNVATLRKPDSTAGFVSPFLFAADSRGRIFVADPFGELGVSVFDATGRYQKTLVTSGRGPGESGTIHSLLVSPGDTLRVFGTSLLSYAPNDAHVRTTALPGNIRTTAAVNAGNGNALVLGMSPEPGLFGHPFHVMHANGHLQRSFGLQAGEAAGRDPWERRSTLTHAYGTQTFWTAATNKYVIEEWSLTAGKRRVLVRDVEWFQPWSSWDGRSDVQRPPPRLMSIRHAPDGLLWVLILVADANWKATSRPARGERRMTSVGEQEERFDTILEVIDLERLAVVTSVRFPGVYVAFVGDDGIAQTAEDPTGEVAVAIKRVALSNYRRSR